MRTENTDNLIRETLRYLGPRGLEPDAALLRAVEKSLSELRKTVRPRFVWKTFPVCVKTDENVHSAAVLLDGDRLIESRDLARNLEGCGQAALFACTLGAEADRMVRRKTVRSMAEAAVCQAACTALAEELADRVNEEIAEDAARKGLTVRPRYSPGYGDCSLEVQKDFFELLELPKKLGLTLTEALLMVPEKSVTAFVGLAAAKEEGGNEPD